MGYYGAVINGLPLFKPKKESVNKPFEVGTGIEKLSTPFFNEPFHVIHVVPTVEEVANFHLHKIFDFPSKKRNPESLTKPSRRSFFYNAFNKLNKIVSELKLNNEEREIMHLVGRNILNQLLLQNKRDAIVSKTGNNELLIYRITDDEYRNLIIDEEGDIELLIISKDQRKSDTKNYFLEDGLNYKDLIENL